MTQEAPLGKRILVFDAKGAAHTADISNIVNRGVDPASIRPALEAYFEKNGLRMATPAENARSGFPPRETRLDRWVVLPRNRSPR